MGFCKFKGLVKESWDALRFIETDNGETTAPTDSLGSSLGQSSAIPGPVSEGKSCGT